jgi:DNA-binding MarR family transcriptional regulator
VEQPPPSEQVINRSEYQRLAAFRYAIRKFLRFSEQASRAAGLTPQQHQALLAIKGQSNDERATITELAEWMQLEHHTVVELVDRMVSSGLVSRGLNPKDRREVLVSLTPRGEEVLRHLSAVTRDELRRLAPALQEMLEKLEQSG